MDKRYNLYRASEKAMQKDFESALKYLEPVLKSYPDDSKANSLHVGILWEQGQLEASNTLLEKLLSEFPEEYEYLLLQADRLRYEMKLDEAEIFYKKTIERIPEDNFQALSDTYLNLGTNLWEQRRRAEALKAWETALELDPENQKAQDNLDQFTNDYGEPAAPTSTFDDLYAFINIQQKRWTGKNQDKFLETIQLVWNAIPFKEDFDEYTVDEKRHIFESIDIDWNNPLPLTLNTLIFLSKQEERLDAEIIESMTEDAFLEILFDGTEIFPGEEIERFLKKQDLGSLTEKIIQRLVSPQENDDEFWAIIFLGIIKTPKAFDTLMMHLQKSDQESIFDAIQWALSHIRIPEAPSRIIDFIQKNPTLPQRIFLYHTLRFYPSYEVATFLLDQLAKDPEADLMIVTSLENQDPHIVLPTLETLYQAYTGTAMGDWEEALSFLYHPHTRNFSITDWREFGYPHATFGLLTVPSPSLIAYWVLDTKLETNLKNQKILKKTLDELKKEPLSTKTQAQEATPCCQIEPIFLFGLPVCPNHTDDFLRVLHYFAHECVCQRNLTNFYEAASEIERELHERFSDIFLKKKKLSSYKKEDRHDFEILELHSTLIANILKQGIWRVSDFLEILTQKNMAID